MIRALGTFVAHRQRPTPPWRAAQSRRVYAATPGAAAKARR
jgi:hypothetical protein